jgi:N-acetylneuraminic acid mutarotase
MIVWGGGTETGGRYDPATDSWTPTRFDADTPSGRLGHTAVWTGREMIVWGGSYYTTSGGRYDPATDRWRPTNVANGVPIGREGHVAVWTGTEMIVWGGVRPGYVAINSGGRYDPVTDRWVPTSADENLPHPVWGAAAVWTGKELVVWGGSYPDHDVGARYDPVTDSWQPTSMEGAPRRRASHTAVWTGSEMIVWGGWSPLDTGGRYDPSRDRWRPTGLGPNTPSPRSSHTAVWTGTEMIVWGGYPLETWGGIYCSTPPPDNSPPRADAGDDHVLECTGERRATAMLDGSRSTDPDSTAGTNDDIVTFEWNEDAVGVAAGEVAAVPFALGTHAVTLTVTDSAGATDNDEVSVEVRDTLAPVGSMTFPAPGQCFGPPALPVTVTDDFADRCDPQLARAYRPQGGPAYTAHGDVSLLLTVTDSSANEAADERSFTIDLVPPVVTILGPPQHPTAPGGPPFALIFVSADDDAASGGPVREVVLLDDCTLYDGSLYGDGDGLLSDESLVMDDAALCRAVRLCHRREWQNPVISVAAWDCGGNRGEAGRVVPGSFRVPSSRCP